jgi:hypothetical protein
MILPRPQGGYNPSSEADRNRQLEQADKQNHKRNRDIEVGTAKLVLTAPNGTRYAVGVDNAGAITVTAV